MKLEFNSYKNIWIKIPEMKDLGYDENKDWLEKAVLDRFAVMTELQQLYCKWNNVSNKMDKTVVCKFSGKEEFENSKMK